MYNYIHPNRDNRGIGGAIIGGVGQVVSAYSLRPASQGTTNFTAPPPANNPPSVSPGSSPESKNNKPSPAFRPKGRITGPVKGSSDVKSTSKPSGGSTKSTKGFPDKSDGESPPPSGSTVQAG